MSSCFTTTSSTTKHGWRNRNRIKTAHGSKWLTIPVLKKGNVEESREIREIGIAWDRPWNRKHLAAIMHSYRKAPYFDWLCPLLQKWYSQTSGDAGGLHDRYQTIELKPSAWSSSTHGLYALQSSKYPVIARTV